MEHTRRYSRIIMLCFLALLSVIACSCGNKNIPSESTVLTDTQVNLSESYSETQPGNTINNPVDNSYSSFSVCEISGKSSAGISQGRPYIQYEINPTEQYEKDNMPTIELTLFGKTVKCSYLSSEKKALQSFETDVYTFGSKETFGGIRLNCTSSQITDYLFKKYGVETNAGDGYTFPVTPASTEKDFITYAQSILTEYCGFSPDGWSIHIVTKEINISERRETVQEGFMNRDNKDPNIQTEYTFTFYRELSGIQRIDEVYVRMMNTGEVYEFHCETYDDIYIPYSNVYIDSEKLKTMVESAFSQSVKNALSHETEYRIVPFKGNLVVEATVQYKYPSDEVSGEVDKEEKRYTVTVTTPKDTTD